MVSAVSTISNLIDRPAAITPTPSVGVQGIAGSATGVPPVSFSDMMAEVASSSINTLKAGEAASIAGVQGKASVQQVVEAVMSAEQTLQTAIAIRDKVVAAYQEIARMAI